MMEELKTSLNPPKEYYDKHYVLRFVDFPQLADPLDFPYFYIDTDRRLFICQSRKECTLFQLHIDVTNGGFGKNDVSLSDLINYVNSFTLEMKYMDKNGDITSFPQKAVNRLRRRNMPLQFISLIDDKYITYGVPRDEYGEYSFTTTHKIELVEKKKVLFECARNTL